MREEKERQKTRSAFSLYLSPAMVERVAANPEALKLGGEMRDMTLMFCDLRGFTTISAMFDAAGLTRLINRFLTPMTDIIQGTGGCVDKYIGDCIMAFWNAPLDSPEHRSDAARAALQMRVGMRKLNADPEGRGPRRPTANTCRWRSASGSIPASAASATWAPSSAAQLFGARRRGQPGLASTRARARPITSIW